MDEEMMQEPTAPEEEMPQEATPEEAMPEEANPEEAMPEEATLEEATPKGESDVPFDDISALANQLGTVIYSKEKAKQIEVLITKGNVPKNVGTFVATVLLAINAKTGGLSKRALPTAGMYGITMLMEMASKIDPKYAEQDYLTAAFAMLMETLFKAHGATDEQIAKMKEMGKQGGAPQQPPAQQQPAQQGGLLSG